MLDLLGQDGYLEETLNFIIKMPMDMFPQCADYIRIYSWDYLEKVFFLRWIRECHNLCSFVKLEYRNR